MRKKKELFISTISAVGFGTLTFLALNPKNKENKADRTVSTLPIKKAGVPEIDHSENAKMVSEGSQFGVDYYNKWQEAN
ncbi:hypothetical protein [Aquibacillus sediminis]|uniref:hypothetical protein n=1 Tax=Aquibacillus sediminis TaxID=2574734 RepID=UPI00110855CA|nr:hypothetical protein [Aquibacillus sediminis]